ncbi:MAG: stage II sporulation protein R [Clostridium sp.]
MKKIVKVILLLCMVSNLFIGCTSIEEKGNDLVTYKYEEVKDILIRFHVIANSDSKEDQELKLKVRDEIINYLTPLLKDSKSIDNSREIIKKEDEKLKKIAEKVIKKNGYNYSVKSTLGKENFPNKTYGNIELPQGEYEAYRIIIGEGKGQNWWCVMFPPLCFVDVTKGKVAYEETEKEMNSYVEEANNGEEIVYKSKIWEVIKEIFS